MNKQAGHRAARSGGCVVSQRLHLLATGHCFLAAAECCQRGRGGSADLLIFQRSHSLNFNINFLTVLLLKNSQTAVLVGEKVQW